MVQSTPEYADTRTRVYHMVLEYQVLQIVGTRGTNGTSPRESVHSIYMCMYVPYGTRVPTGIDTIGTATTSSEYHGTGVPYSRVRIHTRVQI